MNTARYTGMNAGSGRAISDNEHIAQSIGDILLTPIGSRVMRRAYGSQLFNLIDQPVDNAITKLRVMSAIYSALYLWEPRISLTNIGLSAPDAGRLVANIQGNRTDNQTPFSAVIPLRGRA
ncbi:baseplate assembly protein [Enterobacter sp. MF024]|uniref:GPW/gp25 family protein n=1 Tax=Enterobacter sp. MF024 TaxID=2555644 RepID=UPI0011073651|nr:GPW/gp25 family protein [Enterobacter sp. MF024]TLU69595.1 baseplate assembly protein [Enterobacter sp. MF024]